MRLKTRMLLYTNVAIALVITLVSIRLWLNYEGTNARENRTIAVDIYEDILDINYLATQYLLYNSERAVVQLKNEGKSLTSLLSDLKLKAPENRDIIDRISPELDTILALVSKITILNAGQVAGEKTADYQEMTEAYVTQLLLVLQHLSYDVKQLSDLYSDRVATTQSTSNVVAILILLVVILVTGLFLLTFWIYILNPLLKFKQGTDSVAAGNLDYKINIARHDEIGAVASSFNKMTTELKRTKLALEKERDGLETANKELESFSYSVSHDLRAPLRGIDGWSQALSEDYREKLGEQGQQYIDRLRSETQRMGHLIDDLLKLSRETRSEMHWEQVNLTETAQVIASQLLVGAPLQRQVEFMIQPELTANCDARLIEIVLTNLLDNAWKFTDTRPEALIEFGKTERDGESVFFVRDNGIGFDMAYVNKLFRVFQRLHNISEFPGTGIGLATVQRIIHRHGGRVWAEGRIEQGATFYFTLKEAA